MDALVTPAGQITIRLVLDIPRSINHAYIVAARRIDGRGAPRVIKDRAVRQYQHGVVARAAMAPGGRVTLLAPIRLKVTFVMLRVADIDIDNGLKVLIDGLAAAYDFNDRDVMHLEVDKEINPIGMQR